MPGEGEQEKCQAMGSTAAPCCISHEFYRAATESPSRVAVVHAVASGDSKGFEEGKGGMPWPPVYDGDECFTFGEVLSAVHSLSRRLRRFLDCRNDPDRGQDETSFSYRTPEILGVYIAPSVEYIVAVLSILRCGEAFLPLDPSWPKERVISVISLSRASLILRQADPSWTDGSQEINGADWFAELSSCSVLCLSMKGGIQEQTCRSDLAWPCESRSPRMFCYLMFTSGSTGKPKGVCGTEKGLINRFWWMQQRNPLCGQDILLFKTSTSFVDHLQEFLGAILTCTTLIIPPYYELRVNPVCIINFLEAYCVSRLISVPSLLRIVVPVLENLERTQIRKSLKILVLSGEVLPISLWKALHEILPETTILNLYGSTEVSGDCLFFDCTSLPKILDAEPLSSVPIGTPIPNCEIILVGEPDVPNEGEVYVGGACLCDGYFGEPLHEHFAKDKGTSLYFKTGDFAKRLQSGDFIFLGRKDRTIKVHGQRVVMEEVENTLREHPEVSDAAVTFHGSYEERFIAAHIVLNCTKKEKWHSFDVDHCHGINQVISSIKSWMVGKLPTAMIPVHYFCVDSLSTSPSGKVDYEKLSSSTHFPEKRRGNASCGNHTLEIIKEAFSDALLVEVTDHQDFFMMGGTSLSAAYTAHNLGIDMRLLYMFPSPFKLYNALMDRKESPENLVKHCHFPRKRSKVRENVLSSCGAIIASQNSTSLEAVFQSQNAHAPSLDLNSNRLISFSENSDNSSFNFFPLKKDPSLPADSRVASAVDDELWISNLDLKVMCSFSRGNQFMGGDMTESNFVHQACLSIRDSKFANGGCLKEVWKVVLNSCVDASPLIVLKDGNINLFIGSHSHTFLCIDAISGSIRWEATLEGRIECSAAITGDFSQVVVGCYKGKIYFLDYLTGNIAWAFQTDGEVKMQPVVDKKRSLVWCGSHDHWLYALDYRRQSCVYRISCGGSIYGSPSIDVVRNIIYVASTNGLVTAISIEVLPFTVVWKYESGSPIFSSLSLDSLSGNVVCCSVDGSVTVLSPRGVVIWKAIVDGPIFAGTCTSSALPSQVLICCRNGSAYSFNMVDGALLWEYATGDPITASAYIDEQACLISETSDPCDRLVCICSSAGRIYVLRIRANAKQDKIYSTGRLEMIQEFATMDLPGDIFSSPVMIGGRIFVGCRDDYVRCLSVALR